MDNNKNNLARNKITNLRELGTQKHHNSALVGE